jgi:ribosomal protein S18 acetylase RimI-like enzyme
VSKLPFLIHAATVADVDSIDALCALANRLHTDALPHLFQSAVLKDRAFLESLIGGPNNAILVAVTDVDVIGFVIVLDKHAAAGPVTIARRYAEIDNMAVKPDARRNGVGRALILAAADWARQRGITSLELNVYDFNEGAAALYKTAGFTNVYRRMRCPIT